MTRWAWFLAVMAAVNVLIAVVSFAAVATGQSRVFALQTVGSIALAVMYVRFFRDEGRGMSDMTLFDIPDAGSVRADDPHTSVEAARTCDAQRQRDLFRRELAAHPEGLTADDLQAITGVPRMETVPVAGERL